MDLAASVEVDKLFRTQQLSKIEKTLEGTKRAVEEKKTELREKVGNHYREVLASSDSIHSMHQCVLSIRDSQTTLQELRTKLKKKLATFHEEPSRTATTQYKWAKKVKELVDLPSRIQQAVGSHSFLQAVTLLQEGPSLVTTLQSMPEKLKATFRWDQLLRNHLSKLETLLHVLRASCLTAFDEPISLQAAREAISVALTFETEEVDYLAVCFNKWNDGMSRSSSSTAGAIVNFESTLLAAQCFQRGKMQSSMEALQTLGVEPVSPTKLQRMVSWNDSVAKCVQDFVECWHTALSRSFPRENLSPRELHEFVEKTSEVVWDFRLKKGWSAEAWAAVSNTPDSLQTLRRLAELAMVTNIQERVGECRKPLEVAALEAHVASILEDLDESHQRPVLVEAVFHSTSTLVIAAVDAIDYASVNPETQALLLYALYESMVDGRLFSLLKAGSACSNFSETPIATTVGNAIRECFKLWADALPPFKRRIRPDDVRQEDMSSAFMWATVEQQGRSISVPISCSSDFLDYLFRVGLTLNALTSAPMAVDAVKSKLAATLECLFEDVQGLQILFDVHFLLLVLGEDFSSTVEKVETNVLSDPVDKLIYADVIKRLAREHLNHSHVMYRPFFPNGIPSSSDPAPTVRQVTDPLRPQAPRFQTLPVATKEIRQISSSPAVYNGPAGAAGSWAAGVANLAGTGMANMAEMTGIPDVLWKK